MKRFISIVLLGLGWVGSVHAGLIQDYANHGQVTGPTNIDAVVFENFGLFSFTNSDINTNIGTSGASILTQVFIPYDTFDTRYYTNDNSGLIKIAPGFRFDTGTAGARKNAVSFVNQGTIIGQDQPATLNGLNSGGGTLPGPQASQVLVLASNIVNSGTVEVGNDGLLQLTGNHVDLSNGALAAGSISETDPNDFTGREQFENQFIFDFGTYVNPVGVYDLIWGDSTDLSVSATPEAGSAGTYTLTFINNDFPFFFVNTRDNGGQLGLFGVKEESFPSNTFTGQSAFAFATQPFFQSNFIFSDLNVVFVATNLPDTNITVDVGFAPVNNNIIVFGVTNFAFFGAPVESIVRLSEGVPDVVTGDTVSNSVYVIDNGSFDEFFAISTNASYVNGYGRPASLEITTSQPAEWLTAEPANTNLAAAGFTGFSSFGFFGEDALYRAQVGRNPETLDGSFQDFETNFAVVSLADVPDPTNEPGRLEIFGNQVNLSNSRLRGEGVGSLTVTNITGTPLALDWGSYNASISDTNGHLMVSNVFPTTFKRLRGDITVWTGNVLFTNLINIGGFTFTNQIVEHVTWVGPSLQGTYRTTARNFALNALNTTTVQDNVRVIGNSLFLASNLTFNSEMDLTQNAGSFFPTNAPNLKHFLTGSNALLDVDNILDIGYNISAGHAPPGKRRYIVPSITNFGTMMATAPLLQASNFESDGTIIASNSGSLVIEAANLALGTALINPTNLLQADGDITLSANFIGITNSQIVAGGTNNLGLGLLLLETTPGGQITDFQPGTPSTNSYATNFWQVTDGFSLPVKPATGDLYGTEIVTIATNFTVALHTWAGVDFGASSDGFANNVVIGHLKLSRQSQGAQLHFTGASAEGQYGMYVDYLELDTNSLSYTDYREGLVIDPNLTIYFAGSNVDPTKLESAYTNRLVWVPSFFGPNSTVVVPYTNCLGTTQFCEMNANLAFSPVISFFGNLPNIFNQPFVLNDPSGNCMDIATNFTSCGGDLTTFKDFLVNGVAGGTNSVHLDVSTVGSGVITPNIRKSQVAMGKKFTLTATPSRGWKFGGWTATGLPGGADPAARVLQFTLENNLMLTASFLPETFTLEEGAYYGLFVDTNSLPTPATSGAFALSVNADGAGSGKLFMGPATYTFNSQFASNGQASFLARHGSQSVTGTLQLDMTGQTGQVTGFVGPDSIPLLGNLAQGWTARNPSPYAGRFTMILTNGGSNAVPIGDSYGSLTVSKSGVLSVAGALADGSAFSQSVPISKDGLWPFYTYAGRGGDFLLGWVTLTSDPVSGPSINPATIFWNKAASSRSAYYPAGFSGIFDLIGSPYSNPGRGGPVLTLVAPAVTLKGDDMAKFSIIPVASKNNLAYNATNLALTINPGMGTFSGRLQNDAKGPPTRLNGVILQSQDSAFGFFLGTNEESGAVLFQSQ